MNIKTYRTTVRMITFGLALFVAYSIITGLSFLLMIGVIVAAILLVFVLRHLTREVMVDERVRRIEEKAGLAAFRMFTILSGIVSLVIIFFRQSLPAELTAVGETLAYSVCGILLLNLGARYYYKAKL